MNPRFVVLSIATFSLCSVQASPTIYGKAFVTTDYVDAKTKYQDTADNNNPVPNNLDSDALQINSNFSRLGVKGSEAITSKTDIIYQLEYGVDIDGDGSDTLTGRDTYLGFKDDDFGELRFGRNSTILNYTYGAIHTRAYWDNLGNTQIGSDDLVSALNMLDYTRKNNSVLWLTPQYKNFELIVQYATNEDDENDSEAGYGGALIYDADNGITTTLAYSDNIEAKGNITVLDSIDADNKTRDISYSGNVLRGVITVEADKFIDIAPLTLGISYQQADYDYKDADTETGLILSAKRALPSFNKPAFIYLQYNQTDNLNGIENNESKQLVLGGEYSVKDNIIAHGYIGKNSAEYTDPADPTSSVADIDLVAIGGGLEYLF